MLESRIPACRAPHAAHAAAQWCPIPDSASGYLVYRELTTAAGHFWLAADSTQPTDKRRMRLALSDQEFHMSRIRQLHIDDAVA